MRKLRALLAATALLGLVSLPSDASARQCKEFKTGTSLDSLDIGAGAVTIPAVGGFNTDSIQQFVLQIDLTDAGDNITNLAFVFLQSDAVLGTFRKAPMCVDQAPKLVCGALNVDWNPQTQGKNFGLVIPWPWPAAQITITPTGNVGGESLDVKVSVCW